MHHALRAFRHPNYARYFAGQSVSILGTWIQTIAISWMVYRLSGSAFLLGLTGFASQIALVVLTPFGGIWADRVDRRKALVITQWLSIILTAVLVAFTWNQTPNVWIVITLAALLGIVQALETPVRSSLTPELVPVKADLPSAIAFSGGTQNAGRMIGPTLAGLLLVWFSESMCFVVNAVSKFGVLISLAFIKYDSPPAAAKGGNAWASVADGARYTWSLKPLRYLLPMLALMSFCITPYQALMPIFAAEIYSGGAAMLGFLVGAAGVGGLCAVAFLAARPRIQGLMRWVALGPLMSGVALTAFTFSRNLPLSLVLMGVVGFGVLTTAMAVNTIIQTVCDADKRGRVTSYYIICFMGMHPLGCLAAGALASAIGAPYALAIFGAAAALTATWMLTRMPLLREYIRPLYEQAGVTSRQA
jgi:MFS family permease